MYKVNSNSGLLMSDLFLLKCFICKKNGRKIDTASLNTLMHANIMLHPIS